MKKLMLAMLALPVLCGSLFASPAQYKLEDLAVSYDRYEGDYSYPVVLARYSGESYFANAKILISANCANHITIDVARQALFCSPNGDKSQTFQFASFAERFATTLDESSEAVTLNYDKSRVSLTVKNGQGEYVYNLNIR